MGIGGIRAYQLGNTIKENPGFFRPGVHLRQILIGVFHANCSIQVLNELWVGDLLWQHEGTTVLGGRC